MTYVQVPRFNPMAANDVRFVRRRNSAKPGIYRGICAMETFGALCIRRTPAAHGRYILTTGTGFKRLEYDKNASLPK